MKLEKIKDTYNDYKLELSWGQLDAVLKALERNHADPMMDELFAEWQWYMGHVPGPGEEEEKSEEKSASRKNNKAIPVSLPPESETRKEAKREIKKFTQLAIPPRE